jgi:hypothetical protein
MYFFILHNIGGCSGRLTCGICQVDATQRESDFKAEHADVEAKVLAVARAQKEDFSIYRLPPLPAIAKMAC